MSAGRRSKTATAGGDQEVIELKREQTGEEVEFIDLAARAHSCFALDQFLLTMLLLLAAPFRSIITRPCEK